MKQDADTHVFLVTQHKLKGTLLLVKALVVNLYLVGGREWSSSVCLLLGRIGRLFVGLLSHSRLIS